MTGPPNEKGYPGKNSAHLAEESEAALLRAFAHDMELPKGHKLDAETLVDRATFAANALDPVDLHQFIKDYVELGWGMPS
jgi:hypothetical protein